MIYRPEVIRPYTSPEFENERLFPTAYKYFNVDLNYDMLVLNEPLCVVEYMPDGFTKNIIKHYKKNLNSYIYYRRFIMEYGSGEDLESQLIMMLGCIPTVIFLLLIGFLLNCLLGIDL